MSHVAGVKVHAVAFLVALIEAGFIEEAESFVNWCFEELDLNLTDTFEEATTDA